MTLIAGGLTVSLYPCLSDVFNTWHSTQVIASYSKQVKDLRPQQYRQAFKKAQIYNRELAQHQLPVHSRTWRKRYEGLLNVGHQSLMGYVEVGKADIRLPIYHGTEAGTLEVGAGHLDYTSLPVGGKDTHCVIVAHSGLPSAKMFDNIAHLKEGDQFSLHVLERTLTYSVDQISVVRPEDTAAVKIRRDQDRVTLMTCTPLGINNRRLLVSGQRVMGHRVKKVKSSNHSQLIMEVVLLTLGIIILGGVISHYYQKN